VGPYPKLPSVLADFRDSLCIRSGQADSVQQLKRLSLLNVAFFISKWTWGAHCKALSTISLPLMAFRKELLPIMSRSASLRLSLINLQGVVIAVVIDYRQNFLRKKSKGVSSCFVGTVKRYVTDRISSQMFHLIGVPLTPSLTFGGLRLYTTLCCSYCSQSSTVAYARRFGTTQMVEIG
jgi:hypothetical protein